ncbi:hypothetical protein GCM10009107_25110 [Ideonella azotifigens]|uniref:Uncharacterized protein n=1 Tax=Ideonella azotifigens TaxID=513160 RepID=A0ABN1K175_9BURK
MRLATSVSRLPWIRATALPRRCRNLLKLRLDAQVQNKKYLWAIGSTVAGSQVSSWPSARTW